MPEGLAYNDAAVLCDAGITAFHAVDRSRSGLGDTVLIIGVGGVGSFAVQFARLCGAKVVAVEKSAEKCQRALELGADAAIHSVEQEVAAEARRLTGGWGMDCVIDIVGAESTIAAGIKSLANGGRLIIVGYTPEQHHLDGKHIAQNELEIIGTRCGRKRDQIAAAELVASGKIKSIVTNTYPLDQVNEALEQLRSGQVLGRCVLLV